MFGCCVLKYFEFVLQYKIKLNFMKRFLILFSIVFALQMCALAQKYTVSGYVEDSKSGERLIGASVYDANNPSNGISTNVYGFYSLTIPKGEINLTTSFVGFNSMSQIIQLNKDTVINISLTPQIILDEVIVSSRRNEVEDVQISKIDIPISAIKNMPVLMGETDVMKAIQLLPGVQSGTEGMSGIYVRGGGPDQNLILLDGVPVYNVNHLFGFFSVFNGDAVSSVSLTKGGFPARYGGRLSSVIDIRMKEGNIYDYKSEFSVGLIASRLTVEGPIVKGKSSFIISTRRTYLDIVAIPFEILYGKIQKQDPFIAGYFFHDFNAKFNYKFSGTDRIYLSFYGGKDKAYANFKSKDFSGNLIGEDKFNLDWGNFVTAFRWNHIFTPKLFMNTTATYTQFHYAIGQNNYFIWSAVNNQTGEQYTSRSISEYKSGINDIAINCDFDWIVNTNLQFKFGANAIRHQFNPGVSVNSQSWGGQVVDTTYGYSNIIGKEYSAYIESEINIGKYISLNAGGRYAAYQIKDTIYFSPEPRLSARFLISKNLSFKLAYSQMQQNIHLLANSTAGLPTEIWVPATNKILPQKSTQYAGGFAFQLLNKFDITIEGFYKEMTNLLEYKEGESLFFSFDDTEVENAESWESKVEQGKGWSYGAEVFIQKNYGKLNAWLGYTLSWSNRQFETISFGQVFPSKFDRRHDISLTMSYKQSEKIDFGLTWVYSSGNNITVAGSHYFTMSGIIYNTFQGIMTPIPAGYYGHRNNYQMPSYHRLDLGINFHKEKTRGIRTWSISVYNAYCRLNPFYVDVYYNTLNGTTSLKQVTMFPIIPSVSYNFKFK
jgi:outer membrane receptor for ferrienterochelin and colicin